MTLLEKLDRALLYDGAGETSELPEEAATHIRQLEAENAALREAMEPFVSEFEARREAYIRRYPRHAALGASNFDAMPDYWELEKCDFSMGDFRRARALLADRASEGRR